MNRQNLKLAILKTLAYFDLNSYPLTVQEIWQWLYKFELKDLKEILIAIDELKVQNKIAEKNGYFFLVGSEKTVLDRRDSLIISELKLKKARLAIKFIRAVPFLRAVFVCNTVSAGTALEDSDIDFFVIAEMGRVWIVRFFVNLILRLTGLRTYGNKTKDKICLSFFIDDNNLNLEKLKAVDEDIHFVYWISQMMPVYDPKNYLKKFLSANYWIKNYVPNFSNQPQYLNIVGDSVLGKVWKKIWESMWFGAYGDLIEKQARDWQLMKIKLSLQHQAKNGDNNVVINKGVIKLHEHDTRQVIYDKWLEKVSNLVI